MLESAGESRCRQVGRKEGLALVPGRKQDCQLRDTSEVLVPSGRLLRPRRVREQAEAAQ